MRVIFSRSNTIWEDFSNNSFTRMRSDDDYLAKVNCTTEANDDNAICFIGGNAEGHGTLPPQPSNGTDVTAD